MTKNEMSYLTPYYEKIMSKTRKITEKYKKYLRNVVTNVILYVNTRFRSFKSEVQYVAKELVTMRYNMYGKNIEVTEGLRTAVEEKFGKLSRYFTEDTEIHVTFSVERELQKIEVTIPMKGNIIRAEEESADMYASIDLVEDTIERQLRKFKNKLVDKKQNAASL